MNAFLNKKGVKLSLKVYFIDAMGSMALGLFSTLIIGLIIKTIGEQLQLGMISNVMIEMGTMAMGLMGPAIGVAIAYSLKAPPLVLFASLLSGAAGAVLGGPAGSFVAAIISTELGKLISKETKLDIIVTPFVVVFSGYSVASLIGPFIDLGIKNLGALIMWGTEQQPLVMGMIVAVLMGLALTAPISAAAIAMMLDLNGIAAGAATIGCAAQMVGFAVSSYRENKFGGLVAQGLGTSMLQVPNIMRNPFILIPPTIAGLLLAPIGIIIFNMESIAAGAGMGTSGLVGQIMTFTTMGFNLTVLLKVIVIHFIGPAIISLIISEYMRKKGWIKFGDMKLDMGDEKQ
ncbi:PTS sugar transporter subunit IIC [Cytobacillus sp. FSL W7-1323]|uniref:PTS sugar transporter subunit IIC n=1 Tax=Cytobacillus kochii TaxID=859143 RepID=A0A248TKJ4_9BACI|nr:MULTISPECIES: PTS sugar transporter subunit IIC [Cytobacillus]ASV68649.1 PTS sugar transporter subunit IIC [Cytobacillus kochii]MDQ0186185.1 putative membrane protein [Cytobacillus kochii]MEA1855114.1 PTS sugar transporter subunit IIC [Cytobacillus sp. OWB-43]